MKRMIALAFCLTFLAVQGWTQIQQYTIQHTTTPPTIDGVRTAGEWDAAATAAAGFKVLRTTPPGSASPEAISWQAMVDDEAIYLIVETTFVGLTGNADFADDNLPTGDDLEIFFSPNRSSEPNTPPASNSDPRVEDSYQIIVSLAPGTWHRVAADPGPPGLFTLARYDALFGDNVTGSWDPQGLEFGIVSSATTGAVAEFKIPFADLTAETSTLNHMVATDGPANGEVWQWNIGRITSDSDPLDLLPIWNYHAGTNDPATGAGAFFAEREFGEVTFQIPDPSLFESFDSTTGWFVEGNDISTNGATYELTADTTNKIEGDASLKLVYNYSGNQWYEIGLKKTFTTPIDLSEAVAFSFQMYGDPAAAADLIWYVVFRTTSGKSIRYVDWNGLPPASWTEFNLSLRTDMEVNPWVALHDNPVLSEVDQIEIYLQQVTGLTTAGTATVYFDDMHLYLTGGDTQIFTIDDFESYSDTADLQATWLTAANPAGGTVDASLTTDAFQGTKALQLDYLMQAQDYSLDCYRTLDAPLNLERIDYFKIWVKGDPAIPAAQSPFILLSFEDSNVNMVRAWMMSALKTDGYDTYIFYTRIGGEGSTTASPAYVFEQEIWDAGGTCDVTDIRKIHLKFQTGATPSSAYPATLKIDRIEYAQIPIPAAAEGSWTVYE